MDYLHSLNECDEVNFYNQPQLVLRTSDSSRVIEPIRL